MRISDWSSDVCSSDLGLAGAIPAAYRRPRISPFGPGLQLRRGAGTGPPGAGDVAAGSRFPAVDVEARLMPNDDLRRIEAVLFDAERSMTRDEIALYMPEGSDIAGLLASLGESYAGRGAELAESGGKWHSKTATDQ